MKKLFIFFILSMILCLVGCGVSASAEQDNPIKIWFQNRNGQMETFNVVDDETGVHYIVVAPHYGTNGHSYDGVCITPRLNADGSLYVGSD